MTGKIHTYDIIVMGAGPSGSQVAFKLTEMGYSVGVVDKKPDLNSNVCCTGLVSYECVDKYSIPEDIIYRWENSAKIFSPSTKLIHVLRTDPQVAVLNRAAFNRYCAQKAQKAGANYLFGYDVQGIERKKGKVTIRVFCKEEEINLQCKAVVVATGFGAQLLDKMGLGGASDFVMGAQAEVETKDIDEVEVYFGNEIAPEFFAWLVPTSPGKALAGLLSRRNSPSHLRTLLASLAADGKIVSTGVKLAYGGVPLKPLHHTYSDNLLVVGTAAGQVKPITGGGIYFGLICADIAANTLHNAMEKGKLTAEGLAGYQRAWKRRLSRELTTGYWARKAYEMLNDRQVDRAFSLLESTGIIKEMQKSPALSFDWHADVIARLMGQKLFAGAISSIRRPFNSESKPVVKKKHK